MSRTALVTDSTANLSADWLRDHGVSVIPLYVHLDGKTYWDGMDIQAATLYERMQAAREFPTTSQPSVGDFLALYRSLSQDADAIISIHISSGISGTVASAQAARQQLLSELEDPPDIYVMDSCITAGGLGLLVSAAARSIASGLPAEQVAREVTDLASRVFTVFAVDTLEYLHKGGRIGGATALVGSALQIKPILYFRDGRIDVLEKVRTTRRAKQRLLEIVAERAGGKPVHAAVMHAQAAAEAERICQHLRDNFDPRELLTLELSPVIGSHVGPGTVGVSFYTAEEE